MNGLEHFIAKQMYKYRHGRWWMPDRWFIELQAEKRLGKNINLKNPISLTEKLQWLKLHDHNPLYTVLSDKYQAKLWMKHYFKEDYVIPCLNYYRSVDEIDYATLPKKFVIKCNHDSGSVFICYDKASAKFMNKDGLWCDWEMVQSYLKRALKESYFYYDREWPYKGIKEHLIIIEPLCLTKEGKLPTDIKLFYANGEFLFTYVSYGRDGVNDRCTYDKDWNRLPFVWMSSLSYRENINTSEVPRPEKYDEMISIGKEIASYCKFVRIDFFDIDGDLKIGEVTFFHGGGWDRFYPEKYDFIYGEKLKLD